VGLERRDLRASRPSRCDVAVGSESTVVVSLRAIPSRSKRTDVHERPGDAFDRTKVPDKHGADGVYSLVASGPTASLA
jgi:hypothetical protein